MSPPTTTSSSSTTTTTSSKNMTTKKSVTFSTYSRQYETIHVNDYTEEEIAGTWYSPNEMSSFRHDVQSTLRKLMYGTPLNYHSNCGDCLVGLEGYTVHGSQIKHAHRSHSKFVVFDEQEYQIENGLEYDPNAIADMYYETTYESQVDAYTRGLNYHQQAIVANRIDDVVPLPSSLPSPKPLSSSTRIASSQALMGRSTSTGGAARGNNPSSNSSTASSTTKLSIISSSSSSSSMDSSSQHRPRRSSISVYVMKASIHDGPQTLSPFMDFSDLDEIEQPQHQHATATTPKAPTKNNNNNNKKKSTDPATTDYSPTSHAVMYHRQTSSQISDEARKRQMHSTAA